MCTLTLLDDVDAVILFEAVVEASRAAPTTEMIQVAIQRSICLVHVVDVGQHNAELVQLSAVHYLV